MAPRVLSTYVLASKNELKRALLIATTDTLADDKEDLLSDCIEFASDEIERFLDRLLVTRGSITEYHTAAPQFAERLYLTQYPPITITSVQEGQWASGTWTAGTTLTASTDYLSEAAAGILIRQSGADVTAWSAGFERVKVVYTAGYATTAAVPIEVRRVAVALASRRFSEMSRGQGGAQSISDGMGSVTRFLPSELLRMEKEALGSFRRFFTTGRAA